MKFASPALCCFIARESRRCRTLFAAQGGSNMQRLRAWYDELRTKAPGLIALAMVGVLNWIVSDALNFTAIVSELNIDVSGFNRVYHTLLPEFGLFGVMFVGALVCWLIDLDRLTRLIFFIANGIATFNVCNYVVDLMLSLTRRAGNRDAALLLVDAVLVWLMNLIVFTIWFWMLDRGGPDRRATPDEQRAELLFPQHQAPVAGWDNWQPGFTDYLYAAFGSSTSLGPNDTLVLSRRFKVLSMVQTINSLAVIALIAARAIGLFTASR